MLTRRIIRNIQFFILILSWQNSYSNSLISSVMISENHYKIDSLVLKNESKNKVVSISYGTRIKIWTKANTYRGNLVSISRDTIILSSQKGERIQILIKKITRIKDINSRGRDFFGSIFILGGTAASTATVIYFGIGLHAFIKHQSIFGILVVPMGLISAGIIKLGSAIRGPDYRKALKWMIVPPNI